MHRYSRMVPLVCLVRERVSLDVKYVSSVSELGLDTPAYPAYLTVTRLLTCRSVSSVSETEADTLRICRIWGPHPAYLTSRGVARGAAASPAEGRVSAHILAHRFSRRSARWLVARALA